MKAYRLTANVGRKITIFSNEKHLISLRHVGSPEAAAR